ncbi:hypothetical protein ABEV74_22060 [Paenibacillus cisolokensis]|uniref:hypothetical protein n=1 Tax=Paenibacillus cisolokensis TaxID=1658519 RepID=UPI003D294AC8
MKLKLHMDDYVTAIGGVGLLRLQDWACRNFPQWRDLRDADKPIQPKPDYLEVDSSVVEHIPEWYFKYLLEKHSVSAREREKLKSIADFRYQSQKNQVTRLKDAVHGSLKKLESYFPDHPEVQSLRQCLDEIKSMAVDQAATELERLRDRYLQILSTDVFEERLTFNYVRSVILKNFFGQASMLQKSMSGFNLQQHIDRMTVDYIEPLLHDVRIHERIHRGFSDERQKEEFITLLQKSKIQLHNKWAREIKKLDVQEIPAYLSRQLRCSFEEEWFATQQFEEMVFVPLGISGAIPNFKWNFKYHPTPISSWIRLVMFIAPVGLTRFTRFYNEEFETFYSFIFRDGSPLSIYQDNNDLDNMEHNESFDRLIPKLLQREEHKAKVEFSANMQIIEFYSDYDSRKTVMNYYHIPRHILAYFNNENINRMSQLFDRSIREPFLRLVMESIDPIPSIWHYLQKVIRGKGRANAAYAAIRERSKILLIKGKGVVNMPAVGEIKKASGLIYHVYTEGVKIRTGLERRASQQSESTEYVSGGGKRAAGIAHRLLNAAKAGNKQQFLDTVIRLYLTVGEPVPSSLLNVLHEERLDFASWSGAFISGLLSDNQGEEAEPEQTASFAGE